MCSNWPVPGEKPGSREFLNRIGLLWREAVTNEINANPKWDLQASRSEPALPLREQR